MGTFVANKVVKLMIQRGQPIKGARALLLGITFKENCPDVRNTRVTDIYHELESFGMDVDVYDPWADPNIVQQEYGIVLSNEVPAHTYDAIILAVAHEQFKRLDYSQLKSQQGVLFDTKSFLDRDLVDARL
jgi:UDP-N-acetyl-D-galactosamine dehydrogenase